MQSFLFVLLAGVVACSGVDNTPAPTPADAGTSDAATPEAPISTGAEVKVDVRRDRGAHVVLDNGVVFRAAPGVLCADGVLDMAPLSLVEPEGEIEPTPEGDERLPIDLKTFVRLRFTPVAGASCEHMIAHGAAFLSFPVSAERTAESLAIVQLATMPEGVAIVPYVPEFANAVGFVEATPEQLARGTVPGALTLQEAGKFVQVALTKAATILVTADAKYQEISTGLFGYVIGNRLAHVSFAWRDPVRKPFQDLTLSDPALDLEHRLECSGRNVVVLVHGLLASDRSWTKLGPAVEAATGATVLYVRHPSGAHISTNGKELAARLASLEATWGSKIDTIALVGHSMGGMIIRSALDQMQGAALKKIKTVTFIASPLDGSHLGRMAIDGSYGKLDPDFKYLTLAKKVLLAAGLLVSQTQLANMLSPGMRDLRYGYMREADWRADDLLNAIDSQIPLKLPPLAPNKSKLKTPTGIDYFATVGIANCNAATCKPDNVPSKDKTDDWVQSKSAADVLEGADDMHLLDRPGRFIELSGAKSDVMHTAIPDYDAAIDLTIKHVLRGFSPGPWTSLGAIPGVNEQTFTAGGLATGPDRIYPNCGTPYVGYTRFDAAGHTSAVIAEKYDWTRRAWTPVLGEEIHAAKPDCPVVTWCVVKDDEEHPCEACSRGQAPPQCGENLSCFTCKSECCLKECKFCGNYWADVTPGPPAGCEIDDTIECSTFPDCGWRVQNASVSVTGVSADANGPWVSAFVETMTGFYLSTATVVFSPSGGRAFYDDSENERDGYTRVAGVLAHNGQVHACITKNTNGPAGPATSTVEIRSLAGGGTSSTHAVSGYVLACALAGGRDRYAAWVTARWTAGTWTNATLTIARVGGGIISTTSIPDDPTNALDLAATRSVSLHPVDNYTQANALSTDTVAATFVAGGQAWLVTSDHTRVTSRPISYSGKAFASSTTFFGGDPVSVFVWHPKRSTQATTYAGGGWKAYVSRLRESGGWADQRSPFAEERGDANTLYQQPGAGATGKQGHIVAAFGGSVSHSLTTFLSGKPPASPR